jgi:protein TonB
VFSNGEKHVRAYASTFPYSEEREIVDFGLERLLFPLAFCLSVLVHGVIALFCWLDPFLELPGLISPQEGTASVMVRVSDAALPKPTEAVFDKTLAETPSEATPFLSPAAEPLQRPTAIVQLPELKPDAELVAPPDLPDFKSEPLVVARVSEQSSKVVEQLSRPAVAQLPMLKANAALVAPPDMPEFQNAPAVVERVREQNTRVAESLNRPEAEKAPELKANTSVVAPPDVPKLRDVPLPVQRVEKQDKTKEPESLSRPAAAKEPTLKPNAAVLAPPDEPKLRDVPLPAQPVEKHDKNKQPESLSRPAAAKEPTLKTNAAVLAPPDEPKLRDVPLPVLPVEKQDKNKQPESLSRPALAQIPTLKPSATQAAPPQLPELQDTRLPTESVDKRDTKDPEQLNRPIAKDSVPKLEAVTKIADIKSIASEASDASQGAVDELPQKRPTNIAPNYPADALATGQQGTVQLRVRIDAAGQVTAISVYSSSGSKSLDESALTAVRNWVFVPARRAGRPVPSEVLVPIEFFIRRRG